MGAVKSADRQLPSHSVRIMGTSVRFKAPSPKTNQKNKGTVFNTQLNKIKLKIYSLIFP